MTGPGWVAATELGMLTAFVAARTAMPPPADPKRTPRGRYSSSTRNWEGTGRPSANGGGSGRPGRSSKLIRTEAADAAPEKATTMPAASSGHPDRIEKFFIEMFITQTM